MDSNTIFSSKHLGVTVKASAGCMQMWHSSNKTTSVSGTHSPEEVRCGHMSQCVPAQLHSSPPGCIPPVSSKAHIHSYPVTFSQVTLGSLHWLAVVCIMCTSKHFSPGKLLNVSGSLKNQKTMSIIIQALITLRWGKWFIPNFANMAKHENKNPNNPEKSIDESM